MLFEQVFDMRRAGIQRPGCVGGPDGAGWRRRSAAMSVTVGRTEHSIREQVSRMSQIQILSPEPDGIVGRDVWPPTAAGRPTLTLLPGDAGSSDDAGFSGDAGSSGDAG
ncbi:hypothetical protein EFN19_06575, partial [Propionibacterium freudenreichii]|nr:hypothetical protein [Propionibacterium freudenreichii]